MKKNGFAFVETVAVLVIVILALTLFLSSYHVLIRKSKAKDYYDLPKDKYLLYSISNLGKSDEPFAKSTTYAVNKENCNDLFVNKISNCRTLFENTELEYFIIIYDLKTRLESGDIIGIGDGSVPITSDTIEYLKTLRKVENDIHLNYVVGVFKRNISSDEGKEEYKYYYASLKL